MGNVIPAVDAKTGMGVAGSKSEGLRAEAEDMKLREACEELEGVFVEYLIREMRRTVPKDRLFGGGRGEEIFQSMFDQEIAKKIAARGGIGLSNILYGQLSGHVARGTR
ncbi:MAG: rod-binding protein [Bacillota bacterium]